MHSVKQWHHSQSDAIFHNSSSNDNMAEQVTGATTGANNESVLLDPSTVMARRIEGKVRAGLKVEYFVSLVSASLRDWNWPRKRLLERAASTGLIGLWLVLCRPAVVPDACSVVAARSGPRMATCPRRQDTTCELHTARQGYSRKIYRLPRCK